MHHEKYILSVPGFAGVTNFNRQRNVDTVMRTAANCSTSVECLFSVAYFVCRLHAEVFVLLSNVGCYL